MIETGGGLPGILLMTARTIRSLLPPVLVLVARETIPAQAKERVVEVLNLDLGARRGGNEFWRVALLTGKSPMFPFLGEAGLSRMVEAFTFEPNQDEFQAVMFRMAARAIRFTR